MMSEHWEKKVVRQRKDHKLGGDRRKWQGDGLRSSLERVTMALGIGASILHITGKDTSKALSSSGLWVGTRNQADSSSRKPYGKRNSVENNHSGQQFPWA